MLFVCLFVHSDPKLLGKTLSHQTFSLWTNSVKMVKNRLNFPYTAFILFIAKERKEGKIRLLLLVVNVVGVVGPVGVIVMRAMDVLAVVDEMGAWMCI